MKKHLKIFWNGLKNSWKFLALAIWLILVFYLHWIMLDFLANKGWFKEYLSILGIVIFIVVIYFIGRNNENPTRRNQ